MSGPGAVDVADSSRHRIRRAGCVHPCPTLSDDRAAVPGLPDRPAEAGGDELPPSPTGSLGRVDAGPPGVPGWAPSRPGWTREWDEIDYQVSTGNILVRPLGSSRGRPCRVRRPDRAATAAAGLHARGKGPMEVNRGAIVVVLAWFQTTTHPWARAIPGWVSLGTARTSRRARRPRCGSRYPGTAAWYSVNWLACSMKAWPTIGPSTESVWIHIADSTKL